MPAQGKLTRRDFLADGAGALAGASLAGGLLGRGRLSAALRPYGSRVSEPTAVQAEALRVLGRSSMRAPGSLPNPALPSGTDTMPQIEHVVILMMENHSYDNFLGMLRRGDGFTLGRDGLPTAANPDPNGSLQRAFHMPTTCQLSSQPSQEWLASHNAYDNGRLDGFVRTVINPTSSTLSGPVAMGYWTGEDLPFTYDLASKFPIGDRWFCSLLGQTDPNRRFLIAATSAGMTDDIGANPTGDASLATPAPNGTIFNSLSDAGISWIDYAASYPTGATAELFPANDGALTAVNHKPVEDFFSDAASGQLPSVSLIDPDYGTQSQENPQNIVVGEAFLEAVVRAVGSSPLWRRTILVITYDEHGGYYDHVVPPVALAPDSIPPVVIPGESSYDGFARYGFRVPGLVVSPYAKRDYVSHVVYDHTSVLALIERKWNLAALTYRDANANDLTDFLDLTAMSNGAPTFAELPTLAASGDTPAAMACSKSGPGTIPPPLGASPGAAGGGGARTEGQRLVVRYFGRRTRLRGVEVQLNVTTGVMRDLVVELRHRGRLVASRRVARVGTARRRLVLHPAHTEFPATGRYNLVVRSGKRLISRRSVVVG